ncbi:MAG: hypothetical protein FD161_1752 [Limisphaerales bacterium]|nr:MAG: hypothetical protein FD161_1752 [Limisphaerales bacterium]KAG0509188.1 MAG: hypothetical protein E1N63_1671 [Limisphaerales bacterium]TXT52472.1 MAG: hypothetical protein FD140_696 [Limisphaerales bacterium]
MRFNRRKALITGGVAASVAGGWWWLRSSNAWAARFLRERVREVERDIAAATHKPAPASWDANGITLAWLGHATVLLNFHGLTILTDPALGNRIGLGLGLGTLGPKRFIAPALRVGELPPIDVVLLSHAHLDHLDMPTLSRLPGKPLVVSAHATADIFGPKRFAETHELRWSEHVTLGTAKGELRVEAVEVKHWGARWRSDTHRGYNGYILRREGRALLFGGDTANTDAFSALRSRGPFDAAIMPIGAYRPWIRSHCTPEEALKMADAAGARHIVPVHHATFKLSDEPMNEPIERLQTALAKEAGRLALRQVGESFRIPA